MVPVIGDGNALVHSWALLRTLGELGMCFAVPLEKPCCVWGSYFHEGTAMPFRAAVKAGEVHVEDAGQHPGQGLIIAAVAAKAAYPQTLRENLRDRALRQEGCWCGLTWCRRLGRLPGWRTLIVAQRCQQECLRSGYLCDELLLDAFRRFREGGRNPGVKVVFHLPTCDF